MANIPSSTPSAAPAVAEKRTELWLEENREALDSWNAYVDQNGLPLGKYRNF